MLAKISNHFKNKRKRKALKNASPEMIYGYNQDDRLLADTRVGSSTTFVGKKNLKLADNVFIGQYNFIEASNGITIDEGCQITNYISILRTAATFQFDFTEIHTVRRKIQLAMLKEK